MMTKRVDDLKIAGERPIVLQMLKDIQNVFGELKITWNNFVNCGAQRTQDKETKEISLDQIAYAKNLRVVTHPHLRTAKPEDQCAPELITLYQSLLGAVVYLAHTRVDTLVFVSALQGHNHAPDIQHVRRLNKLLL